MHIERKNHGIGWENQQCQLRTNEQNALVGRKLLRFKKCKVLHSEILIENTNMA